MTFAEKKERRKEIAMAIKRGETLINVIRKYNVTEMTIRRACSENGVEFRTNWK